VSDDVPSPVVALVNCSAATVAGSLRLAGPLKDRHVLITGTGMLGVFSCAMAAAEGAASVVVSDIEPERLRIASRFGATDELRLMKGTEPSGVMNEFRSKGLPRFDVTLDYSGVPDTMELGLGVLSVGGTAVWVGATYPERDLRISAEKVVRHLHVIKGLHNYNSEDLARAVNFVEENHRKFPFRDLVSRTFALEEVNEAFDHALSSKAFRIGVQSGRS
jgi:alcohol dehydrogenase